MGKSRAFSPSTCERWRLIVWKKKCHHNNKRREMFWKKKNRPPADICGTRVCDDLSGGRAGVSLLGTGKKNSSLSCVPTEHDIIIIISSPIEMWGCSSQDNNVYIVMCGDRSACVSRRVIIIIIYHNIIYFFITNDCCSSWRTCLQRPCDCCGGIINIITVRARI